MSNAGMSDTKRAREAAEAAEAAGLWGTAADSWRTLAESLAAAGHQADAADAATRAADAFRRDDRPTASARMLRFSLERRPATVRDGVLLAGALLDAGEVNVAVQIAGAAADGAADDAGRALSLDVLVGALLAAGRPDLARAPLAELTATDANSARMSSRFRQAQVARLEGDLRCAEAHWRALAAQLLPHPAAAGALATTWMELGETAVLRTALRGLPWLGATDDVDLDDAEAEACFAAASAAWARAGRRAGYLCCEAWRERLRGEREGGENLYGTIETALAYADERGLAGMAVTMRVLRSLSRHTPLDALHAVELAHQTPLARGRARVIAAELGGRFRADLALAELVHDVPWRLRAERAAVGVEA